MLVSKLHKPTLRALAFAKASRPSRLEALTVDVDHDETERLVDAWEDAGIGIPLKVVASPYREVTNPIIDYVRNIRSESPRDVVTVYIPEYVVGHWWEQILHNQSALRLKGRLLFTPGVMVTSVPYLLALLRQGRGADRTGDGQSRDARRRALRDELTSARRIGPVEVGPVAHGGHCVARHRRPGDLRPARAAGRAGDDHRHRRQP